MFILEDIMEPITFDNISELKSGDWIWDNKQINRPPHGYAFTSMDMISEAIGFRQIHIIDLKKFPSWSSKPFMLSDFDSQHNGYHWTHFEPGRFYKFKKLEAKNND